MSYHDYRIVDNDTAVQLIYVDNEGNEFPEGDARFLTGPNPASVAAVKEQGVSILEQYSALKAREAELIHADPPASLPDADQNALNVLSGLVEQKRG